MATPKAGRPSQACLAFALIQHYNVLKTKCNDANVVGFSNDIVSHAIITLIDSFSYLSSYTDNHGCSVVHAETETVITANDHIQSVESHSDTNMPIVLQ